MPATNITTDWLDGNQYVYDKSRNIIGIWDGTNKCWIDLGIHPKVCQIRTRFTTAQINAGATLLAALTGFKFRMIDCTMIAIGGAAATATAVVVLATQTGAATLFSAAVAALTQSTVVKPNTANVTVLADGASFIANDVSTAITVGKTGGSLATATAIDVIFTYAVEQ